MSCSFSKCLQCMGLAGRVRLQLQVQVSRRHCMREGTALRGGESGSQCQRTDERRDLYSECDGKLGAGERLDQSSVCGRLASLSTGRGQLGASGGGGDRNISLPGKRKCGSREDGDVIDTTCREEPSKLCLPDWPHWPVRREEALGRGLGNFSGTPGTGEQSLFSLPSLLPGLLRMEA